MRPLSPRNMPALVPLPRLVVGQEPAPKKQGERAVMNSEAAAHHWSLRLPGAGGPPHVFLTAAHPQSTFYNQQNSETAFSLRDSLDSFFSW